MPFEWTANLESVEGGTALCVTGKEGIRGLFKVAEPILERAFKKQQDRDVATLKDLLEAQDPSSRSGL